MDETFETVETTDYETNAFEDETRSEGGSGTFLGAAIGAGAVALGVAAVSVIKNRGKVKEFFEAKKEAKKARAEKKWLKQGIKRGYITPDPAEEK